MTSFRFSRRKDRTATEPRSPDQDWDSPVEGPDCGRLEAERDTLQARIDAIEPLCAKWSSLMRLNQSDGSYLVGLEARFGALAPSATTATNEHSFGGLGKVRGVVVDAQTANRKARLHDVEKLRVRADLMRATLESRSEQLDLLARRIDTARASLAPRIEHWNRATQRSDCAGPPLDLYPTVWPSFARWPKSDISADRADDPIAPDLVEHPCVGLGEAISQHNRRVADASPANRQRLNDLADLEGKHEAMRALAADVRAQWLPVKNGLVWRDKMWVEGDSIDHVLNTATLVTVLDADGAFTDMGFGEALFQLSGRQSLLQAQIHRCQRRISARAASLSDEIRRVAEPLRTEAIELEHRKRRCRSSDRAVVKYLPTIDRLRVAPSGSNRWFRAQKILQRTGSEHLTANEIAYVLNDAQTW